MSRALVVINGVPCRVSFNLWTATASDFDCGRDPGTTRDVLLPPEFADSGLRQMFFSRKSAFFS